MIMLDCIRLTIICDENNYKDTIHYHEDINEKMLYWIKDDAYQLNKNNYMEYIMETEEFYRSFPYDSLFSKELPHSLNNTEE